MTHSGSNPPLGQATRVRGLAFLGRTEPETGPQDPEQSCPPHRQAPPSPPPSPAGGLRQAARPLPGVVRTKPREVWAQGTHPRQPNRAGLCAAGRRQDGGPRAPPGLGLLAAPRRIPAAAASWQLRSGGGGGGRAGRRRLQPQPPRPLLPLGEKSSRAENLPLRPPGGYRATEVDRRR